MRGTREKSHVKRGIFEVRRFLRDMRHYVRVSFYYACLDFMGFEKTDNPNYQSLSGFWRFFQNFIRRGRALVAKKLSLKDQVLIPSRVILGAAQTYLVREAPVFLRVEPKNRNGIRKRTSVSRLKK